MRNPREVLICPRCGFVIYPGDNKRVTKDAVYHYICFAPEEKPEDKP